MLAKCSLGGMDFAFPDVCKTLIYVGVSATTVPLPYPNIAVPMTALPPTTNMKHFIMMMPAHNMATTIPMTNGDNVGILGGAVSSTVMGMSRNSMGSTKVFSGPMPSTKWLSPSLHNAVNAPGGTSIVPSQFKVFIIS